MFIVSERKTGERVRPDIILVLTMNNADSKLDVVIHTTPSAPYETSKSSGALGKYCRKADLGRGWRRLRSRLQVALKVRFR